MKSVDSGGGRRAIIDHALEQMPAAASRDERSRAIEAAREALEKLAPDASELKQIQAAKEAVGALADAHRRRLRREEWLPLLSLYLPGGTQPGDKSEAVEAVSDLLEKLPLGLSYWEIAPRIRERLAPVCQRIERRRKCKELIEHGRRYVGTVLLDLQTEGVITVEEWLDSDLRRDLEEAVAETLGKELRGTESCEDVEDIVVGVVENELDLEVVEDEDEDEDEEEE